jgi:D-3-phosphoglycerate dehydrogenase / 2-oxoglutarate reductase
MTGSPPPWRLLVLVPLGEDLIRGVFGALDAEISVPAVRDSEGMHAALADADLVVGDYTGALAMDAAAVAAAPDLAFVQMPSVGVDTCDLDALTAAGVPLANAAGANARSVAEWALAAAFDLARSITWADRRMRASEWPQMETAARGADELGGRRVGILGMGAIGTEVMRLFDAIGCQTAYWSRRRRPDGVFKEIDELLATSDVVVVCLPRTPETAGLLNAERLALMPARSLLVNVARGGIAPDDAVLAALESGTLAGAALDVYDQEPLPADHPLRHTDHTLLLAHCGWPTDESYSHMIPDTVAVIDAFLDGSPINVENPR